MDFAQQLGNFTEYLVREEKSRATVGKYVRDVRSFLPWAPMSIENGVWTKVGPLNCDSSGAVVAGEGTGLSGYDFNFKYIGGHNRFAFTDQKVSAFEISGHGDGTLCVEGRHVPQE